MSTSQSPEEDGSRGTPRAGAAEPAAAPPGAPATGGSLPSRRTWVLAATGGLALLGGFGLWLSRQHAAEQAMDPALRSLWPLKFATPDGATLAMARFTGRPLLLNFWATWCPPCVEELPLLESFYRENRSNGWQVVGIAADNASAVQSFLRRIPLSFPLAMAGMEGIELSRTLGNLSGGLPFTVVITSRGVVAQRRIGPVTPDDLARWRQLG